MDVVVAYDIDTTTPQGVRRLSRVAQTCEGYGVRVQKSVFECRLSSERLQRLIVDLRSLIDGALDSIHVYRFDGPLSAARTSLGRPTPHEPGKPWVF
jgi:CRISPR-associated protein Cas2